MCMCVRDACVCMLCYVSRCADDMPMINLWPHLYATAREIDEGKEQEGGEEREGIMLSEHDLRSVCRVCVCI